MDRKNNYKPNDYDAQKSERHGRNCRIFELLWAAAAVISSHREKCKIEYILLLRGQNDGMHFIHAALNYLKLCWKVALVPLQKLTQLHDFQTSPNYFKFRLHPTVCKPCTARHILTLPFPVLANQSGVLCRTILMTKI